MNLQGTSRKIYTWVRGRGRAAMILGLMFAGFAAAHISWIIQDTRPMHHWDPYRYLGNLIGFLDQLSLGNTALWSLLTDLSHSGRPPLYQLLAAPLVLGFGGSVDVALMINVAFMALLMISTFDAARSVSGERAGYLAAFLVSTYPPLVHLAHVFRPHYAIPACVALSLALLLRVMRNPSPGTIWRLGLSVAFGMWIHPLYGFFVAAALGFAALGAILFQSIRNPASWRDTGRRLRTLARHPLTTRAALPASIAAIALAAVWYAPFSIDALQHFLGNRASASSARAAPDFAWHLKTAPSAISNVLALSALIGFLFVAGKRRLLTTALVSAVAGVYVTPPFILTNFTWWHSASLLPALAIVTACFLAEIRPRGLALLLSTFVILVGAFNFAVVMWDLDPTGGYLSRALGSPAPQRWECKLKSRMLFCPDPPEDTPWPYREILEIPLSDAACQSRPGCRVMVIGAGNFSSFIFGYTAKLHWPRAPVVVESQGRPHRPFPLRCFLESEYVLHVDHTGRAAPGSTLGYSAATRLLLGSPPSTFAASHETAGVFDLPNGRTATVTRRVGEIRQIEITEVGEALQSWNVSYDGYTHPPAGGACRGES